MNMISSTVQQQFLLRIITRAVILFFFAITPVKAESRSPVDLYEKKSHWLNMDWNKVEKSTLWNLKGWKPYKKDQSTKTAKFVKKLEAKIFGQEFIINMAFVKNRSNNRYFTSFSKSFSNMQCQNLLGNFITHFDKPIVGDATVSVPIAKNTYLRMIETVYQWDIGNTRINASCSGSVSVSQGAIKDNGKRRLSVKIGHQSTAKKLVPRFVLSCTRELKRANNKENIKYGDMVFWVDLYLDKILNSNRVTLSNRGSFIASENYIRWSAKHKNGVLTKYTVDRVTGTLIAELHDTLKSDQLMGTISGKCKKMDKIIRKF